MTQSEINNISDRVVKKVVSGRIRDALALLRNTTESQMLWEITDEINRIEQSYAYMLQYLTDGSADPGRDEMYTAIVSGIYGILDRLTRRLRLPEEPTLYFSSLRVSQMRKPSLTAMLDQWQNAYATAVAAGAENDDTRERRELERMETNIFRVLWTDMPFEAADAVVLRALDPATPQRIKSLLVTGLTLGLMEYFDAARLDALIEIYTTGVSAITDEGDERVNAYDLTSMALTGILLTLFKYRKRPLPGTTRRRLDALRTVPRWQNDLRLAFLELIRTRYTERINRTMQEEIIPGMMKMRTQIIDNISKGDLDPADPTANPEWEEILAKSNIADKLRELTELQQEGADVFMSTFSHLKSFPFFTEISNWFIPFEAGRTDVAKSSLPDTLARFIERLPVLCSSDKYSFFLSLSMVPKDQQELMLTQFKSQSGQLMEEMTTALDAGTPDDLRRRTLSGYMRNLYRFYNLFRRKGEFYNPFSEGVNLLEVSALDYAFGDADLLRVVAELFFRYEYWQDAAHAFDRLDKVAGPDGPVFQKLGYACERLGDAEKALEYYHQAEIFTPDSKWLLSRIASVYSAQGELAQAADYYDRLSKLDPESVEYALRSGFILLRQHLYDEAIKQFYKAEYLDSKGTRAWRPLAWALFLARRFDDSQKYYDRILNQAPTATDLLNAGHLRMARGQYKDAIARYTEALSLKHGNTESLLADIKNDTEALKVAGVEPRTIAMVTDALLYSLKK